MNISVDRRQCVGSGICVRLAPDVFDHDPGDGKVLLLFPDPPQRALVASHRAAHECPARAITTTA
ncbi:ferredoxin [Nocardia sp. NPDC052566]|uniref:ferredoxin n=1 Tax=Nocardia sp. NPDC052566 TaxID=3364330 RepID=UPI0037C7353D